MFQLFKKNHSKRIFLTTSHSRTCSQPGGDGLTLEVHVFIRETWTFLSHHVTRRGKQALVSCWRCRNSKYTPRHDTQPREKMHSTATPLVEKILVLGKGDGASLPCLDLPVGDLCTWKVERIHSRSGGGRDQETIGIFNWVVEVNWCIYILDLINHGNDHTAQEHPCLIMMIRRNTVVWHSACQWEDREAWQQLVPGEDWHAQG